MNEFDRRWQTCAARARQTTGGSVEVPAGFASRVWARRGLEWSSPPAAVWLDLSLRALVVATAALVICGAIEFWTAPPEGGFVPHIEDVVTRILWIL